MKFKVIMGPLNDSVTWGFSLMESRVEWPLALSLMVTSKS